MIQGSLNYSSSGRKKKVVRKTKRFNGLAYATGPQPFRRETNQYPSAEEAKQHLVTVDAAEIERRMISSNYTIAPAYNKGAYQVISKDNIKDIGK